MARDPTIAYVLLRNSAFGPRGAASVELCVRDLVRMSRYAGSTFVVCPEVDEPFEGVRIETVPRVSGDNLAKAWAVGRLLRKQPVDAAIVEKRSAGRRDHRGGFGRGDDPAQPRLREGAERAAQARAPQG